MKLQVWVHYVLVSLNCQLEPTRNKNITFVADTYSRGSTNKKEEEQPADTMEELLFRELAVLKLGLDRLDYLRVRLSHFLAFSWLSTSQIALKDVYLEYHSGISYSENTMYKIFIKLRFERISTNTSALARIRLYCRTVDFQLVLIMGP